MIETQESCRGGQVHVVRATPRFGISVVEVQAGCAVTLLSHAKRSVCTPCKELDYIVAGLGKDPITKLPEVCKDPLFTKPGLIWFIVALGEEQQ